MGRNKRLVLPGYPHHITHRGNRRGNTFLTEEDRWTYKEWLIEYTERYEIAVWAYCFMDNHIHAVAVPALITSFSFTFRALQGRYARWINWKYDSTGHLWEGRYFSTPIDERRLWTAVRYVELNPVRAGLVERAEDYPWSSARAHCNGIFDPLLAPSSPFPGSIEDWSDWLKQGITDQEAMEIRRKTQRGEPYGSDAFVKKLEDALGRPLRIGKIGRPRKRKPEK
jgi:putative transposase